MSPERKLKIQNILIIIGIGTIFGLLYNYLFYPHSITEFLEAASISIVLSLLVGILEQFILIKVFRNEPFLPITIIRAFVYSLLASLILSLVLSIETYIVQQIPYTEAVLQYLKGPLFKRDFLFTFTFIVLILFSLQIILLVGRANFFRLIFGLYHRPREISRIFMFVDLKGSTTMAEKLSNEAYSEFIKDYFHDISDAIMMFGGEIYQYVGDEVVVIWPIKRKSMNCINCFFKMEEIIHKKRSIYQSKYGLIPDFKAGMHGGKVIVTSVGKQKKEIVYHGDVLNTASRIEGKCNELKEKLLLSQELLKYIKLDNGFRAREKGEIELKGKSDKLSLYGVEKTVVNRSYSGQ